MYSKQWKENSFEEPRKPTTKRPKKTEHFEDNNGMKRNKMKNKKLILKDWELLVIGKILS